MSDRISVLFVCLGNICRSPTAEGVFRALVHARGLQDSFHIDSAGTGAWHEGEPPDRRMIKAAGARGYPLSGRARRVIHADFDRFDHVLAMDASNLHDLMHMCPLELRAKVALFRDWDEGKGRGRDVPDPYYGGPEGFDEVVTIVERCAGRLLDDLARELSP